MDEISNKTLATLLVVVIVISLAGTFAALRGANEVTNIITGHQSSAEQGYAKVNITTTLEITVTDGAVDFGDGYRNTSAVDGSTICNLSTDDASKPVCWYNQSDYTTPADIQVTNTGNIQINVSIKSDTANGDVFFDNQCSGGEGVTTAGDNWWYAGQLTGDAENKQGCANGGELDTTETSFSTTAKTICTNLTPTTTNNRFNVSIKLGIPAGPSGLCNDSITFTAEPNFV